MKKTLRELADSIKALGGLVQPVIVRPIDLDRYEVVAGARRFRAAKLANLKELVAHVMDLTDEQVIEVQLIENAQRQDVHPYEEAAAYKALLSMRTVRRHFDRRQSRQERVSRLLSFEIHGSHRRGSCSVPREPSNRWTCSVDRPTPRAAAEACAGERIHRRLADERNTRRSRSNARPMDSRQPNTLRWPTLFLTGMTPIYCQTP